MSDLDAMTAALRASSDDAPVDATHTRLKIRESLAPARKKRFAWLVGGGLVFAAGASWALATGQVQRLFASKSEPVAAPAAPNPVIAATRVAVAAPDPVSKPAAAAAPVAATAPVAAAATAPVAEPAALPPPARRDLKHERSFIKSPVVEQAAELEPLYKRAHDLHFHGSDANASLAAWDAYLSASPDGRFAVEARYNRAVDLIKLDRLAEAQLALAPFAAGEVQPSGYRQAEAAELVKRIAKRLNGSK